MLGLTGSGGSVGEFLGTHLSRLVGYGRYLLPVLLAAMAMQLLLKKETEKAKKENINSIFRLYLGSFFLMCFLLGIFHSQIPYEMLKEVANEGQSGGLIGFAVNFFLRPLFGGAGTFITCVLGGIAAAIFAFDISIRKMAKALYAFLTDTLTIEESQKEPTKIVRKTRKINKPLPVHKKPEDSKPFTIQKFTVDSDTWEFPHLNLLDFDPFSIEKDEDEIHHYQSIIKKTLNDFNIKVEMGEVQVGPTVTQYSFKPEAGTKLSKIVALQNDIALRLAAKSTRIEAPIPGKALVGIEIPNVDRHMVKLRDVLESKEFNSIKSNLRLPLGRDISGKAMIADLAQMPHLLVAGSTGSGKSVGINTFLISLLYQNSPNDLKLILVDPKRVEMMPYNGIPHLLTPVITNATKTVSALRWAVAEMTNRYDQLAARGCRNITEFNALKEEENLPFIVIVIDELADLMMVASKEVETLICRLAQMARAVGIHLIVATQRPSVDVVTGLIKANIPARVSFTVSTSHDSKTILDRIGAEKLLGRGDMLYMPGDESNLYRVQGIYTTTEEVTKVIRHVKLTKAPDYKEEIIETNVAAAGFTPIPGLDDAKKAGNTDEDLVQQAIAVIKENNKASASFLQRKLRLGYSRASRIIDMLEEDGIIGPANGSKPREIYLGNE